MGCFWFSSPRMLQPPQQVKQRLLHPVPSKAPVAKTETVGRLGIDHRRLHCDLYTFRLFEFRLSIKSLQRRGLRPVTGGRTCALGAHAAGFLTAVPVQLCVGNLRPLAISCFLACLEACLRALSTRSGMDAAGLLGAARTTCPIR